ncbi:unnamed protein product, partial [Effrenium voratum]
WCAYRLNPSEQRETDNDRKSFELDPSLKEAGIEQTSPNDYRNSGFDKGHLAPSLALSFRREKLIKAERSPWRASYYASNIAPQLANMNQRSWQTLEDALHDYAEALPVAHADVFVVAGLGYWNRELPRMWEDGTECSTECVADDLDCQPCTDDYITVPTFFWKAACDPSLGSFAMIAENDPSSDELEGSSGGWPPSVFQA